MDKTLVSFKKLCNVRSSALHMWNFRDVGDESWRLIGFGNHILLVWSPTFRLLVRILDHIFAHGATAINFLFLCFQLTFENSSLMAKSNEVWQQVVEN